MTLDGRVVAIAGVAGGLGPVVAERLAAAGATIAGADVSQERVDEVGAELALPAERWDGRAVDLLDEEATRAWCAALLERFGRVDALLHLVGGWRGGEPLHEEPLADWDAAPRPADPHRPAHHAAPSTTRCSPASTVASSSSPPSRRRRRPTPTPPTPRPRPPPRPGRSPSPTASKAPPRPPTSSSSTRSSRRGCARRAPARISPPSPPPSTSPTAIAFLCSDAAEKMNGQRLPLTMRGVASKPAEGEMTISELAERTGMTVRNIRAHQTRGLLPPPVVRGRTGYYNEEHVARIELTREMQADGLNLEAIRRVLESGDGAADGDLRLHPRPARPLRRRGAGDRRGRRAGGASGARRSKKPQASSCSSAAKSSASSAPCPTAGSR